MKSVLYAQHDDPSKGCDGFVKTGDVLELAQAAAVGSIIVAEAIRDPMITALLSDYPDTKIAPAGFIEPGLTAAQELEAETQKYGGKSFSESAKSIGVDEKTLAKSAAWAGKSRVEKVIENV